jgi:DNA polymerase-3 subunit gamma/tau
MDSFQVSARKYRPDTFRSVVGQQTITATLKNSIRNHQLAQAFLFCGPRGVGKTTCARILAKTINCLNLSEDIEPCNQCESCSGFNRSASFNIHELDAASNNSVDDIRALIEQVRFAPQIGSYGVYIIDEVHMLSTAAFNAFLKTLEEPPRHAIFILATTERHKILPTILSRCQVFTFNRILVDDISGHLEYVAKSEGIEFEADALHVIAQKADGGLRDALSMFDQMVSYAGGKALSYPLAIENLNVLDYDYYFKLTDSFKQGNYPQSLILLHEILSKGFDLANVMNGLADHFRNLLVCTDESTLMLLEVGIGVRSRYHNQSKECGAVALIKAIDHILQAELNLKSARNQRLNAELAFLKLSDIFNPKAHVVAAAPAQQIQASTPQTIVQQVQPKPPVPLRGIQELRPTVSIKNHLNASTPEIKKDEEAVSDHSITIEVADTDFDESSLFDAWNAYVERLRTEGKQALCGNLTISKPVLQGATAISYQVQNESQLREMENARYDLLLFLKKTLSNQSITLQFVKSETPIKTKPYTASEKLKAWEERNPNITYLRQKLGLKPD